MRDWTWTGRLLVYTQEMGGMEMIKRIGERCRCVWVSGAERRSDEFECMMMRMDRTNLLIVNCWSWQAHATLFK